MARSKSKLTAEEAAAHLGITSEELITSRWRGMKPGSLGFREDGILLWNKSDLPKPAKPKVEESEDGSE